MRAWFTGSDSPAEGSISAALYRYSSGLPDIPGKLQISNGTLHFIPSVSDIPAIAIPLICHVHHHLMPHPSAMDFGDGILDSTTLYLLALVYLEDRGKIDSSQIVYFSGRKGDFDFLSATIQEVAAGEQAKVGYSPPDVNALPERSVTAEAEPPPRRRTSTALFEVAIIGGQSTILGQRHILEIRNRLPRRSRNGDWKLLFQLSTDGCSYQTMFDKVAQCWPVVVAVRTDMNDRIGAFLSCELKISKGYVGQPDSFVWRINDADTVEIFCGAVPPENRFFVACTADEMIIGGDGAAIMIGDMFERGRSQPSATYGSPRLTQKERFRVLDVEVWVVMKVDA
jgi:hypothetical protein